MADWFVKPSAIPNPQSAIRWGLSARGFSFIELMIVMSLLGLFLGTVQETLIVGLRATSASDDREDIRLQLAKSLDQFTREAAAANGVDCAMDQRFQFDADDINGDGSADNDINYRVNSGVFERVFGGTTVTLVTNLTSLDFEYLDSSNASLANCSASGCGASSCRDSLRVVQVTITATKHGEVVSVTDAVRLRNM